MVDTKERVLRALRRPRTFSQIRSAIRWSETDELLWSVLTRLKADGLAQDHCDMTPKWVWELTRAGEARLERLASDRGRGKKGS